MTQISSPCIQRCCLDNDDICIGCYRSIEEITLWSHSQTSDEQKRAILVNAEQRKQQSQHIKK